MNGISVILSQYLNDIESHDMLFNILSKQKHVLFSISAMFDTNTNTVIFKTMNAMHERTSRFNKMIQTPTYTDTYGNTYINIVIS
ncbi:MAG: hypothetical protein J6J11_03725 [Treponema sp.]|nr:hypothetical protein [Treponema sp.]